jgi:serine/threonine-protein kinase
MVDILMAATMGERPKLSAIRPELPLEVDGWLAKALAIDPNERYDYVSTMWNDLLRLVMYASGPSAQLTRQTFQLPE